MLSKTLSVNIVKLLNEANPSIFPPSKFFTLQHSKNFYMYFLVIVVMCLPLYYLYLLLYTSMHVHLYNSYLHTENHLLNVFTHNIIRYV